MSSVQHIGNEDANTGKLAEEKLMAYLEGKLAGDELREVELLLAEESMESDALEGLKAMDAQEAKDLTAILNRQLNKSLQKKKRRSRRGIMDQQWSWMAVAVILLLAIVCFAVVWVIKHGKPT